jgi:serine protease Do
LPNFSSIVRQEGPAVVNVQVTSLATRMQPDSLDKEPDASKLPDQDKEPGSNRLTRGMGSGFIIDPDGIILTNAHVVQNASDITVRLPDRREYKAKLVGIDTPTDTAVLRIDAHQLPSVRTSDPSNSNVGDWVLAIGSPYGFENSVSAGIISAKGRTLPDEGYIPFIQTDVAVNPGNSGGPLINLKGEVIAMNSQIVSGTGGYQGLSFAVPIDVALTVAKQILRDGRVNRAHLGISVQELDQSLADSFGLSKTQGVVIDEVRPHSAAEKAGLKIGDVILKFNDQAIDNSADLGPLMAKLRPEDSLSLTIWREARSLQIAVRFDTLDSSQETNARIPEDNRTGLAVRPLSQGDGLPEARGLMVERVEGPAAKVGIAPGDLVLAANGRLLSKPEELIKAATSAPSHLALLVQRGNTRVFVSLELPQKTASTNTHIMGSSGAP